MDIITKNNEFFPEHFVLCNFYGKDECFCWNDDKFVMFSYKLEKSTSSLPVLIAPGQIKVIQCFSNRVFFTCSPQGVYKLSREGRFSVLSKSAISIGSMFYEILKSMNDCLYLENKQNKSSKLLLRLPPTSKELEELCTLPLDANNSEDDFRSILLDENSTVDNLCLIGNGKKLFSLTKEVIRIIYNCDNKITNIVPVQNDDKIHGLVLITNTDAVVLVYPRNNMLRYKKLYLGVDVKSLCAGIHCQHKDKIWIIYSNGSKLYYMTMTLSTEIYRKVKVEDKNFVCMQYYTKDKVLGLTNKKELHELSTNVIEDFLNEETSKDDFIDLHKDMLKGTNLFVERIYEKSKELESCNKIYSIERNKIHRINLYACKMKVQMIPKMTVRRIAKQLFLNIDFPQNVPNNVYIICFLVSNYETIFSIKEITNNETSIDLPLETTKLFNSLHIGMDLITMINKEQPWFLIKDFVKDPEKKKKLKEKQMKKDKTNFINSKINLIRNLIMSKNLTMKKLSEIKEKIRKEMSDF
ncbi:PREDICTED: uncharacterized protein LOC106784322 [Polistes canadensis]|uniref:uncharacterized protein LOC106784322 n=1 Tax=Polistes canadensis TaxID=91411 RepID=UPI000718E445|nr:PREDICTED: uncharacterized protein LOC106784322 [Polistes canadensis]